MKKITDILIILLFLAIGISYFSYCFPRNIFLTGEGVIISNNEGKKISVQISGEMSKRPWKKSVFKGNIKAGDTEYDGIVYYFNKNDSDNIIYSPAEDKYETLGKAYNEDNLNYLAIELEENNQVIVFPAKTYEEGIKLYNKLKNMK